MYFEGSKTYNEIPSWVTSAISLGYTWNRERSPWQRRIGAVSMPCKSVCPALISLGLLRKDMERKAANNSSGHYEALLRAADYHLSEPNNSAVILINSQYKKISKWNFLEKTDLGISVVSASYRDKIKRRGKLISNPNGPAITFISEANANQWRLEGDAVVESLSTDGVLSLDDYVNIPGCKGMVFPGNLKRSYGGVLLVGGGEHKTTAYMGNIYQVGFGGQLGNKVLGELLTLHASGNMVKRLNFCNQINIDKQGKDYYLVVADGAQAFIRSMQYFRNSDVLGVFSRDEPAENLIILGEKLGDIDRFYKPVEEVEASFNSIKSVQFRLMEAR